MNLTVPMFEPVPPNYYITVISERWLRPETRLPISFKHLIRPAKFPAATQILDFQPFQSPGHYNKEFESIYSSEIDDFNKIRTREVVDRLSAVPRLQDRRRRAARIPPT